MLFIIADRKTEIHYFYVDQLTYVNGEVPHNVICDERLNTRFLYKSKFNVIRLR